MSEDDLLLRDLGGLCPVAAHDELLEEHGAGHIASLANVLENGVAGDGHVLETRQHHVVLGRGAAREAGGAAGGLKVSHSVGDALDVIRGGTAAAANHVDEAVNSPLAEGGSHVLALEVVPAHGVGEAGVGVGVRVAGGHVGDALHEGAHLVGAKSAVESDAQGVGVANGDPESLTRLPGEGAARHVDDGAGDHDGHAEPDVLKVLVDGEKGGLGVEGVEDGLDEDNIGAAIDEAAELLLVGGHELLESDVAEGSILDLGGDGKRAVRGADGRGHHPAAASLLLHVEGSHLGELGRLVVDAVHEVLEGVVGLRHSGAREGVGLADVGAGLEIAPGNRRTLRVSERSLPSSPHSSSPPTTMKFKYPTLSWPSSQVSVSAIYQRLQM